MNNIDQLTETGPDLSQAHETGESERSRMPIVAAVVAVAAVAVFTVAVVWALGDDDAEGWETADVRGQGDAGGEGTVLASDGARLIRRADGIRAEIEVPTPEPSTYEYPTGDMVPPDAEPHPPVSPGASDAPEVFTMWVFAFNDPAQCTDAACDADDVGADTPARGGVYQLDGLVGDEDRMTFVGRIRLGQDPLAGARLENPEGAAIHFAIAPHGRLLPGADGRRQLNSPVGNPSLWWGASFEL